MTAGGALLSFGSSVGVFGPATIEDAASDITDNLVLAAVMVLGLALIVLANIDAIREWLGLTSPAALGRRYRDWLYSQGYRVTDQPVESCHFRMLGEDAQGREITFMMRKSTPGLLTIAVGFTPAVGETEELIQKMSLELRQAIADRLKIECARFGVLFENLGPDFTKVSLSTQVLSDESLTEYHFFEKVNYMRNAYVLFTTILLNGLTVGKEPQMDAKDEGTAELRALLSPAAATEGEGA